MTDMTKFSQEFVAVLRCYKNTDPCMGYAFKYIQDKTGLGRVVVKEVSQILQSYGILKFQTGCMSEDGGVAGSCYTLTDAGYAFLKVLFEHDDQMPRSVWKHEKSKQDYIVLCMTNTEGDNLRYPTTVVYQNTKNGKIYSRPLDDWYRSMSYRWHTPHSVFVPHEATFH